VWLAVVYRRPEPVRSILEFDDGWRDAVVVLAIGGLAGWLLNDTYGMAGSAFAYVSAALLYPTLALLSRPRAGARQATAFPLPD
jgi:hypothetical protein